MALAKGKHVLVEKPIALTLPDAQDMAQEARDRGLFLMEAMWTRFFPAVVHARTLIQQGEIGQVKAVHSDFGFVLDPEERPYMLDPAQGGLSPKFPSVLPNALHFKMTLALTGGGGLMEIGCYPIHAATMALGVDGEWQVAAAGHVMGGVDMAAGITLSNGAGATAILSYTLHAQTPEDTLIIGDKGYIRLHSPAHCPIQLSLTRVASREGNITETMDFPLPLPSPEARLPSGEVSTCGCPAPYEMFHYPHSVGMQYQAQAVTDAVLNGKTECTEFRLQESLLGMQFCDDVRRQLGVSWTGGTQHS